jgi:hypothetical protein
MPKSKYPQKLDSSVEIPPVRDNVLEVGSDAINSLRSAIFNIERVLGINPQGATGNSVSERLSRSLDGNGNLKTDALDRINVLTGPIIDSNVSRVAAIRESKLKLDFPTTLLQDEISILNTSIQGLVDQAEELSVALAIHINANALNRHPSTAISVASHTSIGSDVSIQDIEAGSIQSTFENVFNSHINYTGTNISEDNNSHLASQVYFNNEEVSAVISASDVQEAIVDLSNAALNSQIDHQQMQHSNGILKSGIIDSATTSKVGNVLAEDISISFSKTSGASSDLTIVQINDSIPVGDFNLEKSDILTISDDSDASLLYSGSYEIESFVLIGDNIDTINIFGTFEAASTSLSFGRISKNTKSPTNPASLLLAVREEADLTSARSVQVCNPNSVKVVSAGIRPMEITTSNRFIDVALDDDTAVTIDIYNGDVSKQSIDSAVSRINEQCAEEAYLFLAYRVDNPGQSSELTIAHNLPDELDDLHTITISRASDGGIDAAGFTSIEDVEVSSEFGTQYYINGSSYEGLSVILDSLELSFSSSSLVVNSSASGLDFLQAGIKIDGLLSITDSPDPTDDGTYLIRGVSETQIILDSGQLPSGFTGSSEDATRFRVFSNVASFTDIVFCEISGTFGSVLADVFLSADRQVFLDKRFEYSAEILSASSMITLVDFDGDISNLEFQLNINGGTDLVTISLDGGDELEVRGNNNYFWINSGSRNTKLKFIIPSVSDLNTHITTLGSDIVMSLFGFEGANPDSNILISRVPFDNFNGRVGGGPKTARTFPIAHKGNISLNEISDDVELALSRLPINDLRANGVVYGLEVSNEITTTDLYTFDISRGVCYINGRRVEVEPQTVIITDINSISVDKIFIAITEDGTIKVEPATPGCQAPMLVRENCILASIEFDSVSLFNIDLRLFINDLDLKLLNSISVSPEPGMGHFSEFGKAVKYSKRFSQLFPGAGTPTIHLKSGTFNVALEIDNSGITFADWSALPSSTKNTEIFDAAILKGLVIDFPVNIIGEGDSSILSIRSGYTFSDVSYDFRGILSVPGGGFLTNTNPLDPFSSGFITFRDFKMDNCRFLFPDLIINDGADDLIFGIDIDNVTIDTRGFTSNPLDSTIGPIMISLVEVDDTAFDKGNLSVRNCKFIVDSAMSNKFIVRIDAADRIKNLNFTDNRLMNATAANAVAMFSVDIFSFVTADSGSNIELKGNTATSSLLTTDADRSYIIDGTAGWGDRIGRGLNIGGNLDVGVNADIGGSLTAVGAVEGASYAYNSTYSRQKIIFMDQISDPAMGSTSVNAASFSTQTIDGIEWKTIKFANADIGIEYARIRIEVPEGQTLSTVGLLSSAIPSGSSSFSSYSIEIWSHNRYGVQTLEQAAVSATASPIGDMALIAIGSSLLGEESKYYWIEVIRNDVTGFDEDIHYIIAETEMDSVEAIGGLV